MIMCIYLYVGINVTQISYLENLEIVVVGMLYYFEVPGLPDQIQESVTDVEVVARDVGIVAGDNCEPPLEHLLDTLLRVLPHSSASEVWVQN